MPWGSKDTPPGRIRNKIGPFPHQAAALLNNPLRRVMEDPADTIDAIGLDGYEDVLELGPGSGVFSLEIARRLTTGHLALFDIQAEMLEKAKRRLAKAGHHGVDFHAGDASAELPFQNEQFDVAFLAEVLGEVTDKSACLGSIARVLKPQGALVFHEAFLDPDRLSVSELRGLAEPHGFEFVEFRHSRWKDVVRFENSRARSG
jgi:tRNA A58 N-methylase Trm61